MKKFWIALGAAALVAGALGFSYYRSNSSGGVESVHASRARESLYELKVHALSGEPTELSSYRGKVALVVNVASKCGLTPQYKGLQALYEELAPRDFVILGFPSNDFMGQEPGSPQEIQAFCEKNYGVTFPMFEKVQVKGEGKHPVYRLLTNELEEPTWNFTKYLVDEQGHVVHRFAPKTEPDDTELRKTILSMLED